MVGRDGVPARRGYSRGESYALTFARTLPGAKSTITQPVRQTVAGASIDFVTELAWHESLALLKAAFPVAIRNAHPSLRDRDRKARG